MSLIARRFMTSNLLTKGSLVKCFASNLSTKNVQIKAINSIRSSLKQTQPAYIQLFKASYSTNGNQTNALHKRIENMVKEDDIVVFIKGTADQPRCGFSKAVVDIMNLHGAKFTAHNVLEDEDLRSGIKEFSSWPTIPQVFFKGEFIGGCDILLEMHKSGDLVEELDKIGVKSKLSE